MFMLCYVWFSILSNFYNRSLCLAVQKYTQMYPFIFASLHILNIKKVGKC